MSDKKPQGFWDRLCTPRLRYLSIRDKAYLLNKLRCRYEDLIDRYPLDADALEQIYQEERRKIIERGSENNA